MILDGMLAKPSRRVSTARPRSITRNGDPTPGPAKSQASETPGSPPAANRETRV